jgi:hypothetical protein
MRWFSNQPNEGRSRCALYYAIYQCYQESGGQDVRCDSPSSSFEAVPQEMA